MMCIQQIGSGFKKFSKVNRSSYFDPTTNKIYQEPKKFHHGLQRTGHWRLRKEQQPRKGRVTAPNPRIRRCCQRWQVPELRSHASHQEMRRSRQHRTGIIQSSLLCDRRWSSGHQTQKEGSQEVNLSKFLIKYKFLSSSSLSPSIFNWILWFLDSSIFSSTWSRYNPYTRRNTRFVPATKR